MLPNPFDDQPSRIKTKTAITYAVLITANVAAWTWALIAFVDRPILLGTAFLAYMSASGMPSTPTTLRLSIMSFAS